MCAVSAHCRPATAAGSAAPHCRRQPLPALQRLPHALVRVWPPSLLTRGAVAVNREPVAEPVAGLRCVSSSDGALDAATRRSEMCALVREGRRVELTLETVQPLYSFPLEDWQLKAISAVLEGSSCVVQAPTSSGKTVVAEALAAAALLRGERVIYTTPLKALSSQKLRDFQEFFGESLVGLRTGDVTYNGDASLMIMTTEILRNMLYEEETNMTGVSLVVLDEVHYLADPERGTVWEEVIIHLPTPVKLLGLSATVGNPHALGDWISTIRGPTKTVLSRTRPVPLTWHYCRRPSREWPGLGPLLNDAGTALNYKLRDRARVDLDDDGCEEALQPCGRGFAPAGRHGAAARHVAIAGNDPRTMSQGGGRRPPLSAWAQREAVEAAEAQRRRGVPQISAVVDVLFDADLLPAVCFIFSRRQCDLAVEYVSDVDLVTDYERASIQRELDALQLSAPDAVRVSAVPALLGGIAAHHAGLLPGWKGLIERLFQAQLVKLVFATETLAAGLNMPARTAVFLSLSKRNGTGGHGLISTASLIQMAGRAGRRGFDQAGHVVICQSAFEGAEEAARLLFAPVAPLVSQFSVSYSMALNLLRGGRRSMPQIRELLDKSFGCGAQSSAERATRGELDRLERKIARLNSKVSNSEDEAAPPSVDFGAESLEPYYAAASKKDLADRPPWPAAGPKRLLRTAHRAARASSRAAKLRNALASAVPPTWRAFESLVEVLLSAGALVRGPGDQLTLTELGQAAASLNGANCLWLAAACTSKVLADLKPSELAAVAAALVATESVGDKADGHQLFAGPSPQAARALEQLEPIREAISALQDAAMRTATLGSAGAMALALNIDPRMGGIAEAWAAGAAWRDVRLESGLDEGDLARLLRRTAELLRQIAALEQAPVTTRTAARAAARACDRAPIADSLAL